MNILFGILLMLANSLTVTVVYAEESPGKTKITYLGTNDKKVKHPDVATEYQFELEVFNLDDLSNLEAEIVKGLPKDPAEAERIANERMKGLDNKKAMHLYKGVALLIQWDIKKLPAFVFEDGRYVIYGVTDTASAIKRYVNSRKR
jgi:integrating conjugative element protein (TIGR03757 family)